METQFRRYYHLHARVYKATIRLEHKPALSLEVDWAGTKIAFFDAENGKMFQASLFVAVLPCSQIIYAEPFRDEKLPSWIAGHLHAFQYLGGVPKALIPDNLKSGVKRANFYDPNLNKTYQEMAPITEQRKFYSVPFEYLGEEVDVRATHRRWRYGTTISGLRHIKDFGIRLLMPPWRSICLRTNSFLSTGTGTASWAGLIKSAPLPGRWSKLFSIAQWWSSRLTAPASAY